MTNPITITPRQAEYLSYLTALSRAGVDLILSRRGENTIRRWVREDLRAPFEVQKDWLSRFVRLDILADIGNGEYRIIRTLEDGTVIVPAVIVSRRELIAYAGKVVVVYENP